MAILLAAGLIAGAIAPPGSTPPTRPQQGDLDPGKWQIVAVLGAETANGAPLNNPHTRREVSASCLVGGGSALSALAKKSMPPTCQMYDLNARDGRIGLTGICTRDEDGVSMDFRATGTFTRTRMSLALDVRVEGDGNQATMSGTLVAKRIGPCSVRR